MTVLRTGLKLVLLCALFAACQWAVSLTGAPVPPGLLALVLLIGLLVSRLVPERAVDQGGDLLLRYLPVIFLPPGIGVIRELHLVEGHALGLAAVVLASLAVGQVVAGVVAQFIADREQP